MKLRMQESKFGAPAGVYVGRFLGIKPMEQSGPPRLGRDGKVMPPGMEWQFELTQGEHSGQIVSRITALYPTTKNSCGTLLNGLTGRSIGTDEEVDVDEYVGRTYQIVVGPSRDNPEKTQVMQLVRMSAATPPGSAPSRGGAAVAPPTAVPSLSGATAAPPSRVGPPPLKPPTLQVAPQPAPAAPRPELLQHFWVEYPAGEVVEMTGQQVYDLLNANKAETSLPVMTHDGKERRTAGDFGLHVPF